MSNDDPNVETIETYFRALDDGDFGLASEQFTVDVTYLHPPMYGETTHIRGREALHEYLVDARGKTDTIHVMNRLVSDDGVVALAGHVEERGGGDPLDCYVAYAVFEDGLVDYYIAGLLNG